MIPVHSTPAMYGPGGKVPLKPFTGTIGVAPGRSRRAQHRSAAKGRRQYGCARSRRRHRHSICPMEVAGALFSVGDTHAAQGDGEVCGTAIESPMEVTLTFDLVKGCRPSLSTLSRRLGPVSRHFDEKGYVVTTGIGPDLFQASRDAVSAMIDLVWRQASRECRRWMPICSPASAAISVSPKSSTSRTGSFPSIFPRSCSTSDMTSASDTRQ